MLAPLPQVLKRDVFTELGLGRLPAEQQRHKRLLKTRVQVRPSGEGRHGLSRGSQWCVKYLM